MAFTWELCTPTLRVNTSSDWSPRQSSARLVLLTLLALLLGGCAAHNSATPRIPSPPPPGPTDTPIVFDATAPLCSADDLGFRPTGRVSQMTQDRGEVIEVRNRS